VNIFTLTGGIFIDTEKANDSISKTNEKAQGLASKLGDGIKTAGKWAVGIGAAAGVVGGAMLGVAANTADAMGAIDDSAQKVGTTAEEFQKYAYAAKLSGMETATLESAMIKAQKSFADASEGGKTASEAFKRIGLDVSSMTSDGAFDAAIMALADMENETERNSLANDIFGKSYAELAPMLNEGSAGIQALKDEAVALGGVMSNESVSAGAKFGDMLDKAKTMIDGVFNSLGVSLLPMLNMLLSWVIGHMPEIQATIGTAFGVISKVVGIAYEWFNAYLMPVFDELFSFVQANMPTIEKIVSVVFEAIWDIVSQVWSIFNDNLLPILKALWDFISPTFPLIQGIVELTFGAIVATVQTVVDIFDAVTGAIKAAVEWLTFWNDEPVEDKTPSTPKASSSSSRRINKAEIDGYHAAGLTYVPFDGYIAELHKGERVLTAEENKSSTVQEITVNTPVYLDGKKITTVTSRVQLQNNRGKARALGVVTV